MTNQGTIEFATARRRRQSMFPTSFSLGFSSRFISWARIAIVLSGVTFGSNTSTAMGYNKLSNFMVSKNCPIFRQFQDSAARDLLYLQAEIIHLESEYQKVSKSDREASSDDERHLYAFEWWHLSQSEPRGFGGEQWALALDIRRKLREYCMSTYQMRVFGAF